MVTINQFREIQLRVARILDSQAHPNAQKLLVLTVDVGGVVKKIVAGIANFYAPGELVNKLIVIVNNLEPAMIRGVTSSGMLLAAQGEGTLSLIVPERPVTSGGVVS